MPNTSENTLTFSIQNHCMMRVLPPKSAPCSFAKRYVHLKSLMTVHPLTQTSIQVAPHHLCPTDPFPRPLPRPNPSNLLLQSVEINEAPLCCAPIAKGRPYFGDLAGGNVRRIRWALPGRLGITRPQLEARLWRPPLAGGLEEVWEKGGGVLCIYKGTGCGLTIEDLAGVRHS